MPWDCRQCNTHVPNDSVSVCPRCETDKASWTLAADRTRSFVVTSRKFDLLLGDGRTLVESASEYRGSRPAERAVSVAKSRVLLWHKNKKFPPPEQILIVRMWVPEKEKTGSLRMTVEWGAREAETLPDYAWTITPVKRTVGKVDKFSFDARFLFVHGPEAWPADAKFAGLEVVDVTDPDGPDGHAPRVGVAPFKQAKRVALPLDVFERGWVERLQCYELEFNHESHLLRPEGMDVVYEVLKRCSRHDYKNMRLLVTGHTDSSGDEKTINQPLSVRRCQNLVHLLEGDRKQWAASALDNYKRLPDPKAKLDRQMVEEKWGKGTFAGFKQRYKQKFPGASQALGESWESLGAWSAAYDFYEDELLGRMGELTLDAAALKRLKDLDVAAGATKTQVDKLKEEKAATTDATKLALVTKQLKEKEAELAAQEKARDQARAEELKKGRAAFDQQTRDRLKTLRAAIQWVDPERKYVGCGERYLKVRTGSNEREELNRRDEFLWFSSDRLPWKPDARPATEEAAQEAVYGPEQQADWDYNTNDGPFTFDQLDCPQAPMIEVPPDDAVFVIDRSGSMAASLGVSAVTTRILACRRELQRVLRRLTFEQRFAIIYFDHEVDVWGDGALGKADDARLDDACDWAATLADRGATNTWGALEAGLAVKGVERIVLLSDGLPTVGILNERTILRKVREHAIKVPIDTYGFLTYPEPEEDDKRKRYEAEREAVGKAYEKELESLPDAVSKTDPQTVQDAWTQRNTRVATTLNDPTKNKVKPYNGTTYTPTLVGNVLLGWFLWRLSKDTGGTFHDLTSKFR